MEQLPETENENLAQFVAREARNASAGMLASAGAIGLVVTVGTYLRRPPAWPVFSAAGVMLAALAAWGATDRLLAKRVSVDHAPHHLLRDVRGFFAGIGWLAMLATLFGLLGVALGTIIS